MSLSCYLRSAVGMVWEAADAAQKLPESNKAAYRRFVMKVSILCMHVTAYLGRYFTYVLVILEHWHYRGDVYRISGLFRRV